MPAPMSAKVSNSSADACGCIASIAASMESAGIGRPAHINTGEDGAIGVHDHSASRTPYGGCAPES